MRDRAAAERVVSGAEDQIRVGVHDNSAPSGVVRKRLKLKLDSKKVDGTRVYQIAGAESSKSGPRKSKRLTS